MATKTKSTAKSSDKQTDTIDNTLLSGFNTIHVEGWDELLDYVNSLPTHLLVWSQFDVHMYHKRGHNRKVFEVIREARKMGVPVWAICKEPKA